MEVRTMSFEKIAELIAENKDMNVADITMETTFEDMELDSLDVIEVVMSIEEAFGITLEIEDSVKTVADLVKLVDSLVQ